LNRWLLEQACGGALAPSVRFIRDWTPRFDLLESSEEDRHFVVEMGDDRRAFLRFGDDTLGHQPEAASRFRAWYRVGNGLRGNVGADTITVFVTRRIALQGLRLRARNPLPATGGIDPETLDSVRSRAPHAIRHQLERAVTAQDYADLAARDFGSTLQGAAAELIWTGSWYDARVRLDPYRAEDASSAMQEAVREDLERYRRMGHDLRVTAAHYVPLAITLRVCVKPGYQQAHVLAGLIQAFGPRVLPNGKLGFFHPDNLRFGQSVDASQIVAAAQAVPGVLWSRVTRLERLGEGDMGELAKGFLSIAPSEIARVDNAGGVGFRPGFPEDGSIAFEMEGGR
jgi:predicted phage baseplate assembly protein